MGKYLVTGFPGMGKTTIAHELQLRGYTAYDPEAMYGTMRLLSRKTGVTLIAPKPIPRGWFETEARFDWNTPKIERLLKSKPDVFICCLADNQTGLYAAFDKIFLLMADDEVLKEHLAERGPNAYGAASSELAETIELRFAFEQNLLERGAHPISVQQTVARTVDEILSYTNVS